MATENLLENTPPAKLAHNANLAAVRPPPPMTESDRAPLEPRAEERAGEAALCGRRANAMPAATSNSQPNHSDNENSTNSTWSNSQGSRAASKRLESTHKLNLILPQNQKGCLTTPVFVAAEQAASGNPLFANCTSNPFTQNASGTLFFDPLAHLNNQGEVSLFTGLPSCTPASADLLAAGGINPFFYGTSASVSHPALQSCERPGGAQSEALSLQTRPANEGQNLQLGATGGHYQRQQSAQTSQATCNGLPSRAQENQLNAQQQQQQQHEQQERNKLTIANLQAASALSPLILSPLSLLGLSPEQEAWLRFGYVSPNQHPLAGKSFTQADLNQLNQSHPQLNAMYAQPIVSMHNQYHHQQQQQQQHQQYQQQRHRAELSGQQAAQDLTSGSNNPQAGLLNISRPASQQAGGPASSQHQQQMLYQQEQQHQQQMQQQQQQQPVLYSRQVPIQQQNLTHANQQQRFFQMRVPQTQHQFGVKSLLPTFQISSAYQAQPSQPSDGPELGLPPTAQQSGRLASPAQSQFVHHQGPLRYAPTSSQVAGATSAMAAVATAHQQATQQAATEIASSRLSPRRNSRPLQANFISNQNVISAELRPVSADRCSSGNSLQAPPMVRQDSLPPMAAGHAASARLKAPGFEQQTQQMAVSSSASAASTISQMSEAMRAEKSASSFSSPSSTCDRSQLAMGSAISQSDSSQHSTQHQAGSTDGEPAARALENEPALVIRMTDGQSRPPAAAAQQRREQAPAAEMGPVTMARNETGELVPKKKSRGGRKKKLVTHEEMIARKNRSKERNRVAARRCRQKRKQFLDELRDKIDGLNQLNRKLQKENSALKNELDTFKRQHSACAASL